MVQWLCFFKHDHKTGSKETQGSEISTVSGTTDALDTNKGSQRGHEEEEEEYDDTATGFCCWKGCVTGTLAVFLFFIVFPAGILTINYSSNKKDNYVLIIGIVLTVLPIIVLCIITAVLFYRRKMIKRQRQKQKESVTKPLQTTL